MNDAHNPQQNAKKRLQLSHLAHNLVEAVTPSWLPFSLFATINLFLIGIIYYLVHKNDPYIYGVTTILSFASIMIWSHAEAKIPFRLTFFYRHLIFILLPYVCFLADVFNTKLKNKAYILSQVFVYFMLGTGFLAIDYILLNTRFRNNYIYSTIALILRLICSILLFFFLVIIINAWSGNVSFDYNAIEAVCQTNFEEAVGYFSRLNHRFLLLAFSIVFFIVLIAMNYLPFYFKCNETDIHSKTNQNYAFVFVFIMFLFIFSGSIALVKDKIYYSNIFKLMSSPVSYYTTNSSFKKNRANYAKFVQEQFHSEPLNPQSEGVFVVIIGESLNRNYMSLYNYDKDTTPFQAKLGQNDNVTVFERPYSAYAQTIRCIAYMLTDQNQYNNRSKKMANSISIFDVARYNGYTTRWLSSQGTPLLLDSPTAVLAGSADSQFSLPMHRSKIRHKVTDGDLISFLPTELNKKELIVIQLIGSHYPYANAYPDDFMKDSTFSEYEKSVRYNDIIIQKLFDYFVEKKASIIAYISDHSEDIRNNIGHDPRKEVFTQEMTEIPFWIYVSDEYLEANKELAHLLKRAKQRVFTSDLLFDFMLSIMQLKSSFSNITNNILSDDYFLNESNALTLGGSYKLKVSPSQEPQH